MPSPITLEMLAAARELADTVEVFMAGDGDDFAEEPGEHGAETVYSTGDLDGGLQELLPQPSPTPSRKATSTLDAFLLGTTQDGEQVAARLSVKLDTGVITNCVASKPTAMSSSVPSWSSVA